MEYTYCATTIKQTIFEREREVGRSTTRWFLCCWLVSPSHGDNAVCVTWTIVDKGHWHLTTTLFRICLHKYIQGCIIFWVTSDMVSMSRSGFDDANPPIMKKAKGCQPCDTLARCWFIPYIPVYLVPHTDQDSRGLFRRLTSLLLLRDGTSLRYRPWYTLGAQWAANQQQQLGRFTKSIYQLCKPHWLRYLLLWGAIELDMQGKI